MSKFDIKIKELAKQKYDKYKQSRLVLDISGKDVNHVIVNTLRRVVLNDIPIYAFYDSHIEIKENVSVYDSDYMRERLSQLPIFNVKTDIDYLEDKYWMHEYVGEYAKHPKDKKHIELYINVENVSNENKNVTTDHIEYYENGKQIDNKYKSVSPILLINLRPKDKFVCKMVGVLGVGLKNNIFAGASTCFYDNYREDNKESHKYKFTIESQGQMTEYELLKKACNTIIEKLEYLEDMIKSKYYGPKIKNSTSLVITLDNENHTIGNLLNRTIQDSDGAMSGFSQPDMLEERIIIKIDSNTKDPLKPLFEAVHKLKQMFTFIHRSLNIR